MNVITMYEIPKMGNLRTKMIDNQPWFVAMDVTGILKYRNSRDAVRIHVNECDRRNDISIFNSDGRRQKVTFINESGLLQLIKGSQMPRAKGLCMRCSLRFMETILKKEQALSWPVCNE